MSEHVGHEIAAYLEGTLSAGRQQQIDAHLAECPDCAADYAWARELADTVDRAALRHLPPERIVEIANDPGDSVTAAERTHVEICPRCRRDLDWIRGLPDEEVAGREVEREAEVRAGLFRGPRRRLAWGALAAAAVLAGLVLLRGGPEDLSHLARIEPLPVQLHRGSAEPGSFDEARARGLERYAAGNWTAAEKSLRRALELRPGDDELRLFVGTAVLLAGRPEEATAVLSALVHAEDVAIREEARWQLANASLARCLVDDALHRLDQVIELDGARREDAEKLAGELEAHR